MITEKDLQEAIAECQGVRNPNANTCVKLASYYTILDHVAGTPADPVPTYSFDSGFENTIRHLGDTEFLSEIDGRDTDRVLLLMDELMDTLKVISPRLYNGVMRKLKEVG